MNFLEKDLEEILMETDNKILEEKGLGISGKKYRQKRIGKYGVADLISVEKSITFKGDRCLPYFIIRVFELKKDKIGISAFLQAVRYSKGIDRYLKKRNISFYYTIEITLIGKRIDLHSSFIYLTDIIPNVFLSCYTYSTDINGFKFEYHSDYSLKDEGFKL